MQSILEARTTALCLMIASLLSPTLACAQKSAWTEALFTENRAFDDTKAPSVLVHGHGQTMPHTLVIFLHGWNGCALRLMKDGQQACYEGGRKGMGWDLARHFDQTEQDALFLIPQLALLKRHGKPGAFAKANVFQRFLDESLEQLETRGRLKDADIEHVDSIILVAHSAGYETALALIANSGVEEKIKTIVLFDSLYSQPEAFADWLLEKPEQRRLISYFLPKGTPHQLNKKLRDLLDEHHYPRQELVVHANKAHLSQASALFIQTQVQHGALAKSYLTQALRLASRLLALPSRSTPRNADTRAR
ncbi:MAG: hypothetical protein IPJ88_15595 [Myxococcales bacterium]|nr:MAG: hypothetical protein IPJ88_15595 [Myxococcales bacterium]